MKIVFLLFGLILLLSCDNDKKLIATEIDKSKLRDSLDPEVDNQVAFDKYYDIADLRKHTDTSQFIARLKYYPAFRTHNIIELDEITNEINLCVKEPIVRLLPGQKLKGDRSLAFNQLCYQYADDEAQKIKSLFIRYANNKILKDISCPGCFDPMTFQIEIFDHGQYSSLTKDYLSKDDSIFVFSIFSKVKLTSKNDYSIQY